MNLKQKLAGLLCAGALTLGMGSAAFAATGTGVTNASLLTGLGTNACALTINSGAVITYGTYSFNGGQYKTTVGASRSSTTSFAVAIVTDLSPTDCTIAVHGTDLVLPVNHKIPVGEISLAKNTLSLLGVNTITALTAVDQTLIPTVGPLGIGLALVDTTLTLTSGDDALPVGVYVGSMTFTSSPVTAP